MTGARVVNEFAHGLLVWYTDDGRLVQDGNGNIMNIEVNNIRDRVELKEKGDALRAAARSYGIEGGHANFLSGNRRVSDEEYQNQIARQDAGLVPDIFDPGVIKEEAENHKL